MIARLGRATAALTFSLVVVALVGCTAQSATSSASASAARASVSDAGKALTKSVNEFNTVGTATGTTPQQLAESWTNGADLRNSRLADVKNALQTWQNVTTPMMSRLPATSDGDTMSQQDVQKITAAVEAWMAVAANAAALAQSCKGNARSVVHCALIVSPKADKQMKAANTTLRTSLAAYTGGGNLSIEEQLRGAQ